MRIIPSYGESIYINEYPIRFLIEREFTKSGDFLISSCNIPFWKDDVHLIQIRKKKEYLAIFIWQYDDVRFNQPLDFGELKWWEDSEVLMEFRYEG